MTKSVLKTYSSNVKAGQILFMAKDEVNKKLMLHVDDLSNIIQVDLLYLTMFRPDIGGWYLELDNESLYMNNMAFQVMYKEHLEKQCAGPRCSFDGVTGHSPECIAEHELITSGFDATKLSKGAIDVLVERERQTTKEGWTSEHDDQHEDFELTQAAAAYAGYACTASNYPQEEYSHCGPYQYWPWDEKWWKPKSPRQDLVRAAALLLAEIDRLDRAEIKSLEIPNE